MQISLVYQSKKPILALSYGKFRCETLIRPPKIQLVSRHRYRKNTTSSPPCAGLYLQGASAWAGHFFSFDLGQGRLTTVNLVYLCRKVIRDQTNQLVSPKRFLLPRIKAVQVCEDSINYYSNFKNATENKSNSTTVVEWYNLETDFRCNTPTS